MDQKFSCLHLPFPHRSTGNTGAHYCAVFIWILGIQTRALTLSTETSSQVQEVFKPQIFFRVLSGLIWLLDYQTCFLVLFWFLSVGSALKYIEDRRCAYNFLYVHFLIFLMWFIENKTESYFEQWMNWFRFFLWLSQGFSEPHFLFFSFTSKVSNIQGAFFLNVLLSGRAIQYANFHCMVDFSQNLCASGL